MNNNRVATNNGINASRKEEIDRIILQIQQGDKELEQKFALDHKKFVEKVVEPYENKGVDAAELVEAGIQAIAKASRKYDRTKEFAFTSYAVWWVRQEILQTFKAKGMLDAVKGIKW